MVQIAQSYLEPFLTDPDSHTDRRTDGR